MKGEQSMWRPLTLIVLSVEPNHVTIQVSSLYLWGCSYGDQGIFIARVRQNPRHSYLDRRQFGCFLKRRCFIALCPSISRHKMYQEHQYVWNFVFQWEMFRRGMKKAMPQSHEFSLQLQWRHIGLQSPMTQFQGGVQANKSSMLRITGLLWGHLSGHRWITLI